MNRAPTLVSVSPPDFDAAYQGVPGAFSEVAAGQMLGDAPRLLPCATFEAVFEALMAGRVGRIVVPVENSTVGRVEAVHRLMGTHAVEAVGETVVPVRLALIGPPGMAFAAVRRVRSHPVALGQCAGFFAARPNLEAVEDFDTAGAAARVVAEGRGDEAALASKWAAAVYGGVILLPGVQDRTDNATRFLALRLRP